MRSIKFATILAAAVLFQHACHVRAQAVHPSSSIMGTVTELKHQTMELGIKTEDGKSLFVKVSMDTEFLRVPPGVHDLSKATPASPHDIAIGDHVLVSYVEGMTEARRLVFMPATDIAARNDAERTDWEKRGISAVAVSKSDKEIAATIGESKITIAVTKNTKFRRYAPDSVSFAQATKASLSEIAAGDQIRARGQKSEDGLTLVADEVVFGAFQTKAGKITAIRPESHEIVIEEVGTKAPLTVKLAPESKLKMMLKMQMRPQGEGNPGGHSGPPPNVPTTKQGTVDMVKALSNLPPGNFEDLKVGGAVIVSSTKGAQSNQVTAIMLIGNADMFVQVLQMQADGNGAPLAEILKGHGMSPSQGFSLPAILQ